MANLESRLIELCREFPDGLSQEVIQKHEKFSGVEPMQLAGAINDLLSKKRLSVMLQGSQPVYKEIHEDQALKFRGLGVEEMLVYQLIEQSSNMGIWIRDLRIRSNLQRPQVEKITKTLKARMLVKEVPTIQGKNKKVWMLHNMMPSTEVTGGAWFNDSQELDVAFINTLRFTALDCIGTKGFASVADVHTFIHASDVSKEDLAMADIQSIVDTLLYDGSIETIADGYMTSKSAPLYKVNKAGTADATVIHYTQVPCASCPVFNSCKPGGIISPETCEYLNQWL